MQDMIQVSQHRKIFKFKKVKIVVPGARLLRYIDTLIIIVFL